MSELEEEEEAAEEAGKAEDVLLPESDRVFEVSADAEAVMHAFENKRRLSHNEEKRGSHTKDRREMKKMQTVTVNPEINKKEWKHNSTV